MDAFNPRFYYLCKKYNKSAKVLDYFLFWNDIYFYYFYEFVILMKGPPCTSFNLSPCGTFLFKEQYGTLNVPR